MGVHLVIGGGEHSEAVAARVRAALHPSRTVARPAPTDTPTDPVVAAIEEHLDRLFVALDLPAPVVSDVVARLVPRELSALLHLAREVRQAREEDLDLVIDQRMEVGRLLDLPQRIARALSAFVPVAARWEVLVAPPGTGALPVPGSALMTALREGSELLANLDETLNDARTTALHLAAPDGPVGAARRADAEVLLALRGRRLTAVHPAEGVGVEYLPVPVTSAEPRVERDGTSWLLRVDLPGLHASDLELVRHEDELLMGCAGRSRRLLLPSVLRRCDISRAGVAGGVLTVTMSPDEAVWPRG